MYLRLMPYDERAALCAHLDKSGKWVDLARASKTLEEDDIRVLKRKPSPTEALLRIWDIQNHTVLEVFMVLMNIDQFSAMEILKSLVDPYYHQYIKKCPVAEVRQQIQDIKINNDELCDKDFRIHADNYNYPSDNIKHRLHAKAVLHLDCQAQPVSSDNNVGTNSNKLLQKPKSPLEHVSSANLTVSDISYVVESAGAIPQIPYDDLRKATNNWDMSTVLGKGGFGIVFKGTWKCTQVAIKRIEQKTTSSASQSEQIKQSITELHCLNAYRHDNILPVYGYSIGGPQPCLVYQFMSGGCLERRLNISNPTRLLKWDTRLNIAIGTARGLQFLHTIGDKPLIHGDIKSANILLDPSDNPKIGDFGLAKEGPNHAVSYIKVSRLHGTPPYLPDEFLRGRKFSTKVDTYSFGIVLFELATALPALSNRRELKLLKDHVVHYPGDVMALKDVRTPGGEQYFMGLIEIGKLCVSSRAKERPEMVRVLMQLEKVGR